MDLQQLTNRLADISQVTKAKTNKFDKNKIYSIILAEYGYEAFKDLKSNSMTAEDLVLLLKSAHVKRLKSRSDMAAATRIASADKKVYERIIKDMDKEITNIWKK
jgi:hypothetical protein